MSSKGKFKRKSCLIFLARVGLLALFAENMLYFGKGKNSWDLSSSVTEYKAAEKRTMAKLEVEKSTLKASLESTWAWLTNSSVEGDTEEDLRRWSGGARGRLKENFTSVAANSFEGYLKGKFSGWDVMLFSANRFCPILDEYVQNATKLYLQQDGKVEHTSRNTGRVLIRVEHNCMALFNHPGYGQGNWITSFYMNRFNAQFVSDRVDFMALCTDGEEKKRELILPWIMGYWPSKFFSRGEENGAHVFPKFPWPYPQPPKKEVEIPTIPAQCNRGDGGLAAMVPHIIHDLRRMAVAVMGIPSPTHPSASWAEKYLFSSATSPLQIGPDLLQLSAPQKDAKPLFPHIGPPDDAALHFRCGDLMGSFHPSFGFMNYDAYASHLSPSVRSIGIITSTFGKGQERPGTESRGRVKDACRKVVEGLRDYLKEKFPSAEVNIWNGPSETVVTSYARLIMANQTVVGMGSFGVFPALASFGKGYIRRPDFKKVANHWVKSVPEMYDHVELFDAPKRLMASEATKLQRQNNWDAMFKFFRGE